MSFERYKTQVLLLHSQQSTLDELSSGFNDDYSVHCETSGIDALNTLGDTPINIIVTAQELPGMSGLDALREARKRSKDIVGILLADPAGNDRLDELVRESDNIQVYRGKVNAKTGLELVETALNKGNTSIMAKMDFANYPDFADLEPEHIVIETSENGAEIVSDGTATFQALDPEKLAAASDVSQQSVGVLALTKDKEFLATIRDSARGLYHVHHAESEKRAQQIAREQQIGVLVTDAAIVDSSIETLVQNLRKIESRLVAIVAGRRDDGEMLMDLINRGHVYRFLLKPVSPGRARLAIEASAKHHQDAPDSAFKTKPGSAPSKPLPRAEKGGANAAKRQAAAAKADKAAKAAPPPPAKKTSTSATGNARKIPPTISRTPVSDDLDDVFEVETSFVETMTDIAVSIGQKVSGVRGAANQPAASTSNRENTQTTPVAVMAAAKSSASRMPMYLGLAGAVVAVAVAAWFMTGGDPADGPQLATGESPSAIAQPSPAQQTVANTAAPRRETPAPTVQPEVDESPTVYQILLETARAARDAGNLISPPGNNAVTLYMVAMEEAPNDPTIQAELAIVVSQVLGLAEDAIRDQDMAQADEALAVARLADPDNPRIALLDARLVQAKVSTTLDSARVAIAAQRFDEAERLLTKAGAQAGGDSADVSQVAVELVAARNAAEVAEIVALADARAAAGLYISPPNDSARFHYELALVRDPGNQPALQGLAAVADKLVEQAQQAIGLGRFEDADKLLEDAAALNPTSKTLGTAFDDLAAAREAVAEAERQAEAARVAELERQAELARQAEAERVAELERQAELARQAEAARLAELERQAELARQAEAERVAELKRQAEAERKAQLERQAQIERLAELERQAEVERLAEAKRQAEIAKQAELARLAELERRAEQERLAEIARREEEARLAEVREAERQAVEKNAATAAASSALGVAAAKVRPAPKAESRTPRTPPPATQRQASTGAVAAAPQPAANDAVATNVVATDVAPQAALGSPPRQSSSPAGLTPFSGSSIGTLGVDGAATEPEADPVVPISSLTRTNYVPPVYPRGAQRRNISGAVEVEFTVDPSGAVTDIFVVEATPGDTFSQAAMDAVQEWRFEPVIENGRAVRKRTAVRLSFDLQ